MLRRLLARLRRNQPRNFFWLTPTLAVSGRRATHDLHRLAEQGIRAVVDLEAETENQGERFGTAAVTYLKVPVPDFAAPEPDQLAQTTAWVMQQMQADRPVLIHCRMGLGRSVTFAIATLVQIGYPLADAYNLIRKQCPGIALSEAQIAALRAFAAR